jgi:predicted PurR-regulated permease PerM
MKARLGERRASAVMSVLTAVDRVFGRYISAKLLLALIMFAICSVVFSILGVRYTVLMSAIVALSTLVPYIGPFVGAVPPIVLSLIDSPQKGITVAIAIVVIHAVDNYFFEPAIFSDRMGLSPFWILLSVIVGGGLFGFWGVLLAVPAASVIKLLIVRYIRGRQLKKRREKGAGEQGGAEAPGQD